MMDEIDMTNYNNQIATERWALPQFLPRLYLNQVDTLLQAFMIFRPSYRLEKLRVFRPPAICLFQIILVPLCCFFLAWIESNKKSGFIYGILLVFTASVDL